MYRVNDLAILYISTLFGWNVKGRGAGLMPSILSDFDIFTPWSLGLFICVSSQVHGEHKVLQAFAITHLHLHLHLPGTHFHLNQVKHLKAMCLAQGQNIETMSQFWRGEKHDISLKIMHQTEFETARRTSTKPRALTVASCPTMSMH